MSIPDRVGADWDSLRDALLSRNEDWDVWTNWYSARLRGRVTYSHLTAKQNEEIEVARVLEIIEDDWKQGPAHVNAKVRQIEARYHSRNAPEEPDDLPPEPAKPISIEPPRPSAIEPEWNDGRLVLPKGAAASGTPAESLSAALSTLHKALQKLADDTRGLNNADPRFAGFLDSLLADFPNEAPSQEDLFRTGHAQTVLDAYAATVSAEWPNLLAAEYQATLLTFRRTVRQFDKWRDFVEAAEGQSLDGGEIVEAVQTAKSLETILQTEEAEDFVAPEIPEALSEIAGAIEHADGFDPIEAGKEDLAKDLLNGIDNIVQRIAEAALTEYIRDVGGDYLKGVSEGFRKSLKDMSEKDGERLAKWSRRVLIAGATSYGAWLAGISPIARIAQKFPEIAHWLEPIIRFLIG